MAFASKLLPILREGIEIVKMICFKKLKEELAKKHPDQEKAVISRLAGNLVNTIFAAPAREKSCAGFEESHADLIAQAQADAGSMLAELLIPLTDALRMQALCDHQEGRDSAATLRQAQAIGILLTERDLPLPHRFIELVRRVGSASGLLQPPPPEADATRNL